ncbi:MAG: hypothetical protein SGPRY_005572, partial [Prymnesium sp.]
MVLRAARRELSTLPAVIDAHQHYYEPSANAFSSFLASLGASAYTPADYRRDSAGVEVECTVHVEAMPDEGAAEASWLEGLVDAGECRIGAIVGNCKLPRMSAPQELSQLVAASPLLRGVRFILDHEGTFDGKNATHVAVTAPGHGGVDFLRDPNVTSMFERGFKLLAKHNLSFDLHEADRIKLAEWRKGM